VDTVAVAPQHATVAPQQQPRVKDPKRVAAGLRLAQKNREARVALARETNEVAEQPAAPAASQPWSLNSILGIGGITIGVVGLYLQYRSLTKRRGLAVATQRLQEQRLLPQPHVSRLPIPIRPHGMSFAPQVAPRHENLQPNAVVVAEATPAAPATRGPPMI